MTQLQKVALHLIQNKEVNNFWALENRILRLGAIVHKLKKNGWIIKSKMRGKNCVYELKEINEV